MTQPEETYTLTLRVTETAKDAVDALVVKSGSTNTQQLISRALWTYGTIVSYIAAEGKVTLTDRDGNDAPLDLSNVPVEQRVSIGAQRWAAYTYGVLAGLMIPFVFVGVCFNMPSTALCATAVILLMSAFNVFTIK